MIRLRIGIHRPDVLIVVPAHGQELPVTRQALHALGRAIGADLEALEDAELALTEACANAFEHAYADGGPVEVEMRPRAREILVTVRDRGRGLPGPLRRRRAARRGYGIAMMRAIASEAEVRPRDGGGTEVVLCLPMGAEVLELTGSRAQLEPVERIVRRITAVVAAQADMPSDRLVEALLVAELAARHAPAHLEGATAHVGVERLDRGFELCIGPLRNGGAAALMADSEMPVVGSVVGRLADSAVGEPREEGSDQENLVVRVTAAAPGAAPRLG